MNKNFTLYENGAPVDSPFHMELAKKIKDLTRFVAESSAEGEFEGHTFGDEFFKNFSNLCLVILVADSLERDVFENHNDMKSRVNMFLSAMRTCFKVETTNFTINENEED